MPLSLMDRLPLPNLKAYTAGSALLLSGGVYYALSVTGDAAWRANSTLPPSPSQPVPANHTRNLTENFVEVMAFMMQEPLCMWVCTHTYWLAVIAKFS